MSPRSCECCGAAMRPLFTGEFCPNDCDRPKAPPPTAEEHLESSRGLRYRVHRRSTLWVPIGGGAEKLACPSCPADDPYRWLVTGQHPMANGTLHHATCGRHHATCGRHHITVEIDDA